MCISSTAEQQVNLTEWSSWINPYHTLETRITHIASQKISELQDSQIVDLKQAFKVAHKWTYPAGRMKQLLSTLPKETVQAFMFSLMTSTNEKEVNCYFEKILKLLPKNLLLEMSGFHTSKMSAALYTSRGLTKGSALKNNSEKEVFALLNEFLIEFKYFCKQLVDILIALTGVNKLARQKDDGYGGSEVTNGYEAEMKLELYWKFLACPVTLFGIIYSYIQSTPLAALLTTVTIGASLTAIVAYNRYWKPCPIDLQGLENLSIELLSQKNPIYPRREILQKIESAFQAKKGVILVGKKGCGKSLIARSFALEALAGKICNFIKNPQVFTCPASDLASLTYDSASFSSIKKKFKSHSEQVVFFFDEFHSLFIKDGIRGNFASEKIKTFWDDFKYIVGATTTDEYKKYIQHHPAIDLRRFEIVKVDFMDEIEMKTVLSQYIKSTHSQLMFDQSVIDHIIANANQFNPGTSIIDAASSLLAYALAKMDSTEDTALNHKIANLENQSGIIQQELDNQEDSFEEISRLNELFKKTVEEFEALKGIRNKRDIQVKRMQDMERYHQALKLQSYKLADPSIELVEGSSLERQWIELHARIKTVREFISKERIRLGLPPCLNKQLIDSLLDEKSKKDS